MRSKRLIGAAALALAALVLAAAGPAAPQNWQYLGNATAGAPDFTAGMAGSALPPPPFWGRRYYSHYPGYACAPSCLPRYDHRPRR
ncbi:MAG TPA: hypothetical protein VKT99_20645 [Xanthobacteraceae bacterium]|jgi:hypothetical protein|nr:hypothetical protein [Xanthobacteraceae bacterium]